MKKNRVFTNILAIALVFIAVIVVVIMVGLFRTSKDETLEGQAETTDYRLSSKVPARVLEIRVKEGDFVHKGDTLVVLEAQMWKLSCRRQMLHMMQPRQWKRRLIMVLDKKISRQLMRCGRSRKLLLR